ncbi:Arc family DNA-binding protein [Methylorubrum extorquens]|uniref:Arc family DNA-binding protein n=1 Tax=Methylorubrum extorquens TaxID=408 RepID=UPI0009E2356E|nr:Arc family DNA-binding protein [Methylorubrum extorquens]MCP1544556.1 hypothetical protein [Methylorubrum extorquens]MCP1588097.1 hypothetical protein [Methylorubrum extorquens]
MANETTGRESDKFMLRLPEGMRDRLKAEAEANKRSMNAEIVSRLEATFDRFALDPNRAVASSIDKAVDITLIRIFGHALGGPFRLSSRSKRNGEILKELAKDLNSFFDGASAGKYSAADKLNALRDEIIMVIGENATEENLDETILWLLATNIGTEGLLQEFSRQRDLRNKNDATEPS